MAIDLSTIVSKLGDEMIAKAGEPLGLDAEQSVRVARALGAHLGKGEQQAVQAAAADTGLTEEVISAMLSKLVETGKEKLMEESGMAQAMAGAQDQAMAALSDAGGDAMKKAGGFLGGLFKKK